MLPKFRKKQIRSCTLCVWRNVFIKNARFDFADCICLLQMWSKFAPGEARTHNLRISPYLSYKYGALTDCATGADIVK